VLAYFRIAFFVFAALLGADDAWGTKKPSKTEATQSGQEQAKIAFKAGQQAYDDQDFALAYLNFSAAYDYLKLPELVFNMAQCKRLQGRHSDALELYEQYLGLVPDAPERGEIEGHLRTLRLLRQKDERAARREDIRAVWGSVGLGAGSIAAFSASVVFASAKTNRCNINDVADDPTCVVLGRDRALIVGLWGLSGALLLTAPLPILKQRRKAAALELSIRPGGVVLGATF
jgi:tetratricopeptide (TPR) repeat protein